MWPWKSLELPYNDDTAGHTFLWIVLSPSSSCSDLKGVSVGLRLLVEFPRRSGREEDTDTTEGFLLHFNTDGNSSTTGNSSGAGNSSCGTEDRGEYIGKVAIRLQQIATQHWRSLNISAASTLVVHSTKPEMAKNHQNFSVFFTQILRFCLVNNNSLITKL